MSISRAYAVARSSFLAMALVACASHAPRATRSRVVKPLTQTIAQAPERAPDPATRASEGEPRTTPAPLHATLVAGGDVELARALGQRLLREPSYDPFAPLASILSTGDVRFVNLESPLSEQRGETISPVNPLVFTGPPIGADALARAQITIVSTANNHAWDYGKRGLLETLENLDRVHVAHVGTATTRDAAYAPVIIRHGDLKIAFLAVTDIWNQGPLEHHEASEYVARADAKALAESVVDARKQADFVLVSHHGGDEYTHAPTARTRAILRAAIDAGADAVLGHHPHVVQGIEWRSERPILYSMGNLLMQMHRDHEWTGMGYLARLTLTRGEPPKLEVCPHRILGIATRLLRDDPAREPLEAMFFAHLRETNARIGSSARVAKPKADGCAEVTRE